MSFITNIRSVAKYESKILVRSWFFRIFTLLAVVFLGFFNFAMMLMEDNFGLWFAKSVSSNIPYLNLLLLNTGQAVSQFSFLPNFWKGTRSSILPRSFMSGRSVMPSMWSGRYGETSGCSCSWTCWYWRLCWLLTLWHRAWRSICRLIWFISFWSVFLLWYLSSDFQFSLCCC